MNAKKGDRFILSRFSPEEKYHKKTTIYTFRHKCAKTSTEPEACVQINHKAAVQKEMSYICNIMYCWDRTPVIKRMRSIAKIASLHVSCGGSKRV